MVSIAELHLAGSKAKVSMPWPRQTAWEQWAALSEGCYLLRTNLTDLTAEVL
jgi:hypothetical protein